MASPVPGPALEDRSLHLPYLSDDKVNSPENTKDLPQLRQAQLRLQSLVKLDERKRVAIIVKVLRLNGYMVMYNK